MSEENVIQEFSLKICNMKQEMKQEIISLKI